MKDLYVNVYRKTNGEYEAGSTPFESFEDAVQDVIDVDFQPYYSGMDKINRKMIVAGHFHYEYTLSVHGRFVITEEDKCEVSPTYANRKAMDEKYQNEIDVARGK